MSRKFFGTDGIRGVANQTLTPEFAFNLGHAVGTWLKEEHSHPEVAIGRDTRRSGPMLECALTAGLNSVGVSVRQLGVVPTPTVSFVTAKNGFSLGVVISASHNPAPDNGIKFFGHDGRKLSEASEEKIESFLTHQAELRPTGREVGAVTNGEALVDDYVNHLTGIIPNGLSGMKIALDCAHGAATHLGPKVLSQLGADLTLSGTFPDGMNINAEGGATKPHHLAKLTVESGAEVGIAFDGDADRCIFADTAGAVINGDQMMAAWATYLLEKGLLNPSIIIGTVMTNGGLEAFLHGKGIHLLRANVGDKYVTDAVFENKAHIGGEQSGHIVIPKNAPTGDGLATALEFLAVMVQSGWTSEEISALYEPWPQVLLNWKVAEPKAWNSNPAVVDAVKSAEQRLSGIGRINLRPSGTQPMLRLMVEAQDELLMKSVLESVSLALQQNLAGELLSTVDLTHGLGD